MAILAAGCGSTPSAAPVIERSLNSTPITTPPSTPVPVTSLPAVQSKPSPSAATPARATAVAPAEKTEEPEIEPYREGDWRPEHYVVRKGDTLYSIALDHGRDYRDLAAWNNLEDPALIRADQRLRLFPPEVPGELASPQAVPLPAENPSAPVPVPLKTEPKVRKLPYSEQAYAQLRIAAPKTGASPAPTTLALPVLKSPAKPPPPPASKDTTGANLRLTWEWPTQGNLIYGFGAGPNQKGVGIGGRKGQPVLASAPGKVVYSGSGLRGYGKLIIIKHNESYLSVYAHNSEILVKEGQSVAKGQKIAEMGDTDNDRIALHFEIRRLGMPIDPLQYLPERAS